MIDFLVLGHENQGMFQIEEDTFLKMSDANAQLKRKTGLFIDPYGTSRISADHCQLLYEMLANHGDCEKIVDFRNFMKRVADLKASVIVYGE